VPGAEDPRDREGDEADGGLLDTFLLSTVAMINPTLLAAVTVMLLLPHPKTADARLSARRLRYELMIPRTTRKTPRIAQSPIAI
jgi:tRNA U38,U39,U40 pseudouridine synthase TruA